MLSAEELYEFTRLTEEQFQVFLYPLIPASLLTPTDIVIYYFG